MEQLQHSNNAELLGSIAGKKAAESLLRNSAAKPRNVRKIINPSARLVIFSRPKRGPSGRFLINSLRGYRDYTCRMSRTSPPGGRIKGNGNMVRWRTLFGRLTYVPIIEFGRVLGGAGTCNQPSQLSGSKNLLAFSMSRSFSASQSTADSPS